MSPFSPEKVACPLFPCPLFPLMNTILVLSMACAGCAATQEDDPSQLLVDVDPQADIGSLGKALSGYASERRIATALHLYENADANDQKAKFLRLLREYVRSGVPTSLQQRVESVAASAIRDHDGDLAADAVLLLFFAKVANRKQIVHEALAETQEASVIHGIFLSLGVLARQSDSQAMDVILNEITSLTSAAGQKTGDAQIRRVRLANALEALRCAGGPPANLTKTVGDAVLDALESDPKVAECAIPALIDLRPENLDEGLIRAYAKAESAYTHIPIAAGLIVLGIKPDAKFGFLRSFDLAVEKGTPEFVIFLARWISFVATHTEDLALLEHINKGTRLLPPETAADVFTRMLIQMQDRPQLVLVAIAHLPDDDLERLLQASPLFTGVLRVSLQIDEARMPAEAVTRLKQFLAKSAGAASADEGLERGDSDSADAPTTQ